ncbi:MAG: helix-turn-helix transcriptional regulator [Bacteroidota bacterium]
MKDYKLGEFEEVILLLVGILGDDAYAYRITDEYKSQSGRGASIGTVHSTLERLLEKGFVESRMGEPGAGRGGRRKRIYSLTADGEQVLRASRDFRVSLWNQLPGLSLDQLRFAW